MCCPCSILLSMRTWLRKHPMWPHNATLIVCTPTVCAKLHSCKALCGCSRACVLMKLWLGSSGA